LGSSDEGSKSAAIGRSSRGKIGESFGGVICKGDLLLFNHVSWMVALILRREEIVVLQVLPSCCKMRLKVGPSFFGSGASTPVAARLDEETGASN
jgi:hypothetical protein